MIRQAQPEDTSIIDSMMATKFKNGDYKRYREKILKHDKCYISLDQGEYTGVAYVEPKVLSLHDTLIKTSYIVDVVNADAIMDQLLSLLSRDDIITLVRTDNSESFEKFGFEPVVESFEYNLNTSLLSNFDVAGINLEPSNESLVKVYQQFTRHFTGFFTRDTDYFERMKTELSSYGGIIGFNVDDQLVAYIIYEIHDSVVHVRECCYLKSGHLLRLLSFITRGKSRLILSASVHEHMNRILPDAKKIRKQTIMARINDKELFERLFHIKIISAYSGFNAFAKPLWNQDIY